MLSEAITVDNRTEPFHWWFAPNWLGLDAPCIALIWTWAVSRASHETLPAGPAAALFLVVWFIYLSDRLIDVAGCRDWAQATGRLRFGRNHRTFFRAGLGFCFTGILGLLWAGLPGEVIRRAAEVGFGVGLYAVAFVKPVFRRKLPGKEFAVGVFFALGIYACLGATSRSLPLLASIASLAVFNCLVIAARDAESDRAIDPGGASHWWRTMNRDLFGLGVALTLAAAWISVLARETAFYLSVMAAFAALTALHRNADRLSGDTVRALADFALLTPIPMMAFGYPT